jgi:hypothetical protein
MKGIVLAILMLALVLTLIFAVILPILNSTKTTGTGTTTDIGNINNQINTLKTPG